MKCKQITLAKLQHAAKSVDLWAPSGNIITTKSSIIGSIREE